MTKADFRAAMRLMRRRDPQAREDGFFLLQPHAAEFVDELIAEFDAEQDHGLQCWLLELIGDARSSAALPLLAAQLAGEDPALRDWAVKGLGKLDTREARTLLYEAGER